MMMISRVMRLNIVGMLRLFSSRLMKGVVVNFLRGSVMLKVLLMCLVSFLELSMKWYCVWILVMK